MRKVKEVVEQRTETNDLKEQQVRIVNIEAKVLKMDDKLALIIATLKEKF